MYIVLHLCIYCIYSQAKKKKKKKKILDVLPLGGLCYRTELIPLFPYLRAGL